MSYPIFAADLTITATTTVPLKGSQIITGTAGATITAGQPIYRDPTTATMLLCAANLTSVEANASGIAVCNSSTGQPVTYQSGGNLTVGATLVPNTTYVVSPNSGKVCPALDLAAGNYITILGVAKDASTLVINVNATGVVR